MTTSAMAASQSEVYRRYQTVHSALAEYGPSGAMPGADVLATRIAGAYVGQLSDMVLADHAADFLTSYLASPHAELHDVLARLLRDRLADYLTDCVERGVLPG